MASLSQQIETGLELLRGGRYQQAAGHLRRTLHQNPGHPDALNLLSVATFQLGDHALAATYAEQAVNGNPAFADYHSNLGRYYTALGRTAEALEVLQRAIHLAPAHAAARYNLASALAASGDRVAALGAAEIYAALAPDQAAAHHLMGTLLSELGRPEQAIGAFESALAIEPFAETHNNFGNALQSLARSAEAVLQYERALRLREHYPEAACNMGAALQSLGHFEDARAWFGQALRMQPGFVQAHVSLAHLEAATALPERAVELYRQLLAEHPSAESWNNFGNLLQELGRYDESLQAYEQALALSPNYFLVHNNVGNLLRRQGRAAEALPLFERALALNGSFAEAWNNRGVALAELGQVAAARASYERAQQAKPGYPDPFINLGNLWRDTGQPARAVECYRHAAEIDPANPYAWNNLGCALGDSNSIPEAIHCFERAVALMPANHQAFSNILLNLHYLDEPSPDEMYQAHVEFGGRYDSLGEHLRRPFPNSPDPNRPLRIGYVSADFRRHSVAYFLEPVLEQHHHGPSVEAYCYADIVRPDAWTGRFATLAGPRWRDIRGFSVERFTEQVRADGIDILVDLGGHTAHSRLAHFTARPAPVQVTWLGYPDTTGLPSIGYRITDAMADPPGPADSRHTERLVRLDGAFLCFRPPAAAPAPAPVPSLAGAPFTFGSFNNLSKLSPATLDLWTRILKRTPGSRLMIKNRSLNDSEAREHLAKEFTRRGIAADRLVLMGMIDSLTGHLDAYAAVDLALDTLPYHGTTTTCEALWMGVPVVTLAGRTHASRVGLSLLSAAGLGGFVATDAEGYVELAASLARHPSRLAPLRAGLRAQMEGSPLRDEAGFTARLEAAYRSLWQAWCRTATDHFREKETR